METRRLGDAFDVSALTLGGGGIGGGWGPTDEAEAIATIHAAIDAGITFIDVAPMYQAAEERVGAALATTMAGRCRANRNLGYHNQPRCWPRSHSRTQTRRRPGSHQPAQLLWEHEPDWRRRGPASTRLASEPEPGRSHRNTSRGGRCAHYAVDRSVSETSAEAVEFAKAANFRALAAQGDESAASLAHRYALTLPGVDTVVLGVKNRQELHDCLTAEALPRLTQTEIKSIEQTVDPAGHSHISRGHDGHA